MKYALTILFAFFLAGAKAQQTYIESVENTFAVNIPARQVAMHKIKPKWRLFKRRYVCGMAIVNHTYKVNNAAEKQKTKDSLIVITGSMLSMPNDFEIFPAIESKESNILRKDEISHLPAKARGLVVVVVSGSDYPRWAKRIDKNICGVGAIKPNLIGYKNRNPQHQ